MKTDIYLFRNSLRAGFSLFLLLTCTLLSSGQVTWTHLPTPNPSPVRNLLRGIAGTSTSDVWAVGQYQPNPATLIYKNLAMHWNGAAWQTMPVTNLSVDNNDLWAVKAVSPTLAFAVGAYNGSTGGYVSAQILKWNGNTWTQQSIPHINGGSYLFGLGMIAANDLWAVGGKAGSPFLCYAMHYNGSSWSEVPVPPAPGSGRNNFNAVHGLTSNDVWAVGTWGVAVGDYHFLAMHWNGSTWTYSPIPNTINNGIDGELTDVKVVSSNDVWATGYSLAGGRVLIHYDGTSWSQAPGTGGGGALAVLGPNNVYGVAGDITHWNGSTWAISDTLMSYPWLSLVATTVLPNGEIWAAGRTVDSNNVFQTLVYRTGPNVTTGINAAGSPFEVSIYPNPFNHAINLQLSAIKSQDAEIRLIDLMGRIVLHKQVPLVIGKNAISLDVPASAATGLYILEINADGVSKRLQVMKQ